MKKKLESLWQPTAVRGTWFDVNNPNYSATEASTDISTLINYVRIHVIYNYLIQVKFTSNITVNR